MDIAAAIAIGVLLWWYFQSTARAPDTGGGGGGAPFPPPSSDTPSTPPTIAPALPPLQQQIVALVLQLTGDQDPALVLGIIERESRFNPSAQNRNDPGGGAWGLMQILATTAAQMGVADPRALLDPATNIATGVKYLDWIDGYLSSHGAGGGVNQKIAAWNEGARNALAGLPDYAYVAAVTANMAKWRGYLDSVPIA